MKTESKLKVLQLLCQRPDATGSGIYLQAMMREGARCGHENFMLAGIQSDAEVEMPGILPDRCRFVRFNGGDLKFPIPGMTDIMPYPSTRFADLSEPDIEAYESVFESALTETVTRFRPDIIHGHHNWLLSSLARNLFPDIPMVTTCHGTDLRQFENCPHLREKVLRGCRRLDAAMVLSTDQKTYIERNFGLPSEKVIVTGAGYDDRIFSPGTKPDPCPVQIVYAGKWWNAKGLPWLLEALKEIPALQWQLHIVGGGSGAEKEECMRLARLLGRRVMVHGLIPQSRLAEIFKRAHIFVLPSLFEGLPLVMLEALASGCRVIATDLPGVMEVLGGVTAEFITLVRTPRLRNMDQPYREDLPDFVRNLAAAIKLQIERAISIPRIDLSMVRDKLYDVTWRGVFARVEKVYFKAIEGAHREIGTG